MVWQAETRETPTCWLYIGFGSVTEAMRAEKVLQEHHIPGQLIPTPRQITLSCGMCWRTEPVWSGDIQALAKEKQICLGKMVELPKQ